MLDTKGPQLPPPPPLRESGGGGGCGGAEIAAVPLTEAALEQSQWRSEVDDLSEGRMRNVKENAAGAMADINRDIKKAQDRWHQTDIEVNKYQGMKNRGTLINDELLQMAQEERQEAWQELQHQKGRIQKVEAWRDQKMGEIRALTGRAKGGDYNGYRGLRNFDWSYHPSQFK
jgi:chromosome segregation ATPase